MKKLLCTILFLLISSYFFESKAQDALLCQQWVLKEVVLEGKLYTEDQIADRSGIKNILEFRSNGESILRNEKGQVLQRNQWQWTVGGKEILISSDADEDARQVFQILELKSKKLILLMEENGADNVFVYKRYKPKK